MLTDKIKEVLIPREHLKTLIITVGNELRSDDAVACYIAKKIIDNRPSLILMNAKNNPENIIDKAVSQNPEKVVIIDAANFGGSVGEARLLNINEIDNFVLSTHTFPLSLIGKIVKEDTGAEVYYLGIQIKNAGIGDIMSEEVVMTADEIIKTINGGIKNA